MAHMSSLPSGDLVTIPAQPGTDASFRSETTGPDGKRRYFWTHKPVVAWTDDGDALIVGRTDLVRARTRDNFHSLTESHQAATVGVIPGGGWLVEFTDDDGSTWIEPILAWTVEADGSVKPQAVEVDGSVYSLASLGGKWRIFHPDFGKPSRSTGTLAAAAESTTE